MKELPLITQHQNKTLTPIAGSVARDTGSVSKMGRRGGGCGGDRRTAACTGDEEDPQGSEASCHCCKSSAGPCKLSDKLRMLKM